eukprot:Skav211753  [mRNA]  locus=scaffold1548:673105:678018:- [translate_table: standard]
MVQLTVDLDHLESGQRVNVVVSPVIVDSATQQHVMVDVISRQQYKVDGSIPLGHPSYALLNVTVVREHGMIRMTIDSQSFILAHDHLDFGHLSTAVEMCCGAGYLGIGAQMVGIRPLLGVDSNHLFTKPYAMQHGVPTVTGDVNDPETISKVWALSPHRSGILAGVSCQPYSALGDRRGGQDSRASSLTGVLQAAHWLGSPYILLECVEPAQRDPFVTQEVHRFCQQTGFKKHDIILKLDNIWPARRSRWWCFLLSPLFPDMGIQDFPQNFGLQKINQLISSKMEIPSTELECLLLDDVEKQVFGVDDQGGCQHTLNVHEKMPCALHAWGSQVHACPCQCRSQGLSPHRLQERGLHGVVILEPSCQQPRHIHPAELAILSGVDPYQEWESVKFSLCALGLLATPLQSLWMCAHLRFLIDKIQAGHSKVTPFRELAAYMTWLIARAKMIWEPRKIPGELAGLVEAWMPLRTFSMDQLWEMTHWNEARAGLTLAQILDMILQAREHTPLFDFLARERALLQELDDEQTEAVDESAPVIPPTEPFEITEPASKKLCVRNETQESAAEVFFSDGAKVQDLIDAESKLHGSRSDVTAVDEQGCELSPDSALQCLTFTIPCPTVSADTSDGESGPLPFLMPSVRVDSGESGPLPNLMPCNEMRADRTEDHGDMHRPPRIEPQREGPPVEVENNGVASMRWASAANMPSELRELTNWPVLAPAQVPALAERPEFETNSYAAPVMSVMPVRVGTSPLVDLDFTSLVNLGGPMPVTHQQLEAMLGQANTVKDRQAILDHQQHVWGDDEIRWHMHRIIQQQSRQEDPENASIKRVFHRVMFVDPLLLHGWVTCGVGEIPAWIEQFDAKAFDCIVMIAPLKGHWVPFVFHVTNNTLCVRTWDDQVADHSLMLPVLNAFAITLGLNPFPVITREHRIFISNGSCGALAISFVTHVLFSQRLPMVAEDAKLAHASFRNLFAQELSKFVTCVRPWLWCAGAHEQTCRELSTLLAEQGVPTNKCDERAAAAVHAIGLKPVSQELQSRNPWRQLKAIANQAKYQFLMPDELQAKVEERGRGPKKAGRKQTKPFEQEAKLALDPTKLLVSTGTFEHDGSALNQLQMHQIGPLAEGIILTNPLTAEPYLRANQIVSKCPLALLVLGGVPKGMPLHLAHAEVTVPCRCTLDQEPLLLEADLVQIGTGEVTKTKESMLVSVATLEVSTVKFVLYRDETEDDWNAIAQAPLKYIVSKRPTLTLCTEKNCQCACWHNPAGVETKAAIQDVWRRQFLRHGFKPEKPAEAVMFSVCVRVPSELLMPLLKQSGLDGIYCEPRTLDGKAVAEQFAIVWAPRTPLSELRRLKQTLPDVIGLARNGDRMGLRVYATAASTVHAKLKPDAVFLANGPKKQFVVGPMPYGSDRASISRALIELQWEARALQPIASRESRGNMWLVQAHDDPPQNLVQMSHGEIVITRHKSMDKDTKVAMARPIASPSTLALCGAAVGSDKATHDPWQSGQDPTKKDPWQRGHAEKPAIAPPTDSLQRIERQIEQAVLAKIPTSSPDMTDRIHNLESQVHQIMSKHQALETHVREADIRQSNQLTTMQQQLNHQGQQLQGVQGALEVSQQNMAAMFESQMSQIRGLFSKRTIGDTSME